MKVRKVSEEDKKDKNDPFKFFNQGLQQVHPMQVMNDQLKVKKTLCPSAALTFLLIKLPVSWLILWIMKQRILAWHYYTEEELHTMQQKMFLSFTLCPVTSPNYAYSSHAACLTITQEKSCSLIGRYLTYLPNVGKWGDCGILRVRFYAESIEGPGQSQFKKDSWHHHRSRPLLCCLPPCQAGSQATHQEQEVSFKLYT